MTDKPDEKPATRDRTAMILIETTRDWLTNGGEYPERAGWSELTDQIRVHLQRFNWRLQGFPTLSFVELLPDEEADITPTQGPLERALGLPL